MPELHYAQPAEIPEAQTDHILRKQYDLAYARLSPAQKLDIYWPAEGNGPFPTIVALHGGAFMWGDKHDFQLVPLLEGLERGYAVVSINYRMSGEAKFPALVQDAKAAVRWLRANAQELMLDGQRIAAWGDSAGGYLAAMLGVTAGVPYFEDLSLSAPTQPSDVQAVVVWFGPADFLKMDEQLREAGLAPKPGEEHSAENSPESLLMGGKITSIAKPVRLANPETYVHPGLPPFLLQHGTRDETVPCQQAINFAERLKAVLGPKDFALDLLEGAGHLDPRFSSAENMQRVFTFLDAHLK